METTVLLFARFRSFEVVVRDAFEQTICLVVCMYPHKLRCKITKYLENSKEKGLIFSAAVEITQDYTGFTQVYKGLFGMSFTRLLLRR